jgi:hypothetical protein
VPIQNLDKNCNVPGRRNGNSKDKPFKSWRDVLPVHPAAELFPCMSETELRELGEDIKARGIQSPVILCKRKLLDGRNRLDAMELVGIGLDWSNIDRLLGSVALQTDPNTDPYEYVVSANLYRRHLTSEQKRELIAKVLKAKPEASNRQIAKQVKADDKTVAKVRGELEGRSEIPNVETRTDTKGRDQPSAKPKKSANPAAPAKTDPIIVELNRSDYFEVVTSVPPRSRPPVSTRDIALEGFSALTMELVRRTRNNGAERFAKTTLSIEDIRRLGHFLLELANVCEKKRKAEHDAKREAECAALFGEAAS